MICETLLDSMIYSVGMSSERFPIGAHLTTLIPAIKVTEDHTYLYGLIFSTVQYKMLLCVFYIQV